VHSPSSAQEQAGVQVQGGTWCENWRTGVVQLGEQVQQLAVGPRDDVVAPAYGRWALALSFAMAGGKTHVACMELPSAGVANMITTKSCDVQVAVVLLHGPYHFGTPLDGGLDTTPP
jgi:hypothetical protein